MNQTLLLLLLVLHITDDDHDDRGHNIDLLEPAGQVLQVLQVRTCRTSLF